MLRPTFMVATLALLLTAGCCAPDPTFDPPMLPSFDLTNRTGWGAFFIGWFLFLGVGLTLATLLSRFLTNPGEGRRRLLIVLVIAVIVASFAAGFNGAWMNDVCCYPWESDDECLGRLSRHVYF